MPNLDATQSKKAACGGVFRDEKTSFVAAFTYTIGTCGALEVKLGKQ